MSIYEHILNFILIYIKDKKVKNDNIHLLLYRYQIYISGEIPNYDNSKMESYLKDNYDLMFYNSIIFEAIDEDQLLVMMGSCLMIVMFQNNEIQNKEINTARRLNIPILFIYNSEEDKKVDTTNEGEYKIVFKNFKRIEMILKYRFKLIKKIKKRKDLH